MFSWLEYHSPYAVVLVSLSWMECVGLTERAVVHKSIVVSEPPRFQKSGTPTTFTSDSSVGLGQMFPGSRPAERRCASIKIRTHATRASLLGVLRPNRPASDREIDLRPRIIGKIFITFIFFRKQPN